MVEHIDARLGDESPYEQTTLRELETGWPHYLFTPFHGENTGSSPVGVTIIFQLLGDGALTRMRSFFRAFLGTFLRTRSP